MCKFLGKFSLNILMMQNQKKKKDEEMENLNGNNLNKNDVLIKIYRNKIYPMARWLHQ